MQIRMLRLVCYLEKIVHVLEPLPNTPSIIYAIMSTTLHEDWFPIVISVSRDIFLVVMHVSPKRYVRRVPV